MQSENKTNTAFLSDELLLLLKRQHFHLIITGERHRGKSTLLNTIISNLNTPIKGFYTTKITGKENIEDGVYIHDAQTSIFNRFYDSNNRVATLPSDKTLCSDMVSHIEIFNTLGVTLLSDIKTNDLIVIDEIGVLESKATNFTSSILNVFNSKNSLVAVIKRASTPFLDSLLTHKNNTAIIEVLTDYHYSFKILPNQTL